MRCRDLPSARYLWHNLLGTVGLVRREIVFMFGPRERLILMKYRRSTENVFGSLSQWRNQGETTGLVRCDITSAHGVGAMKYRRLSQPGVASSPVSSFLQN